MSSITFYSTTEKFKNNVIICDSNLLLLLLKYSLSRLLDLQFSSATQAARLFHHLGEGPARASDIEDKHVRACRSCKAMADRSYDTFFRLPLWELGSGPHTSFTDEDLLLIANLLLAMLVNLLLQALAAIQTPALQA